MANLSRPKNSPTNSREYGDANATLAPSQQLKADVTQAESSWNV